MDAEAHYYERLREFATADVAPGGIVLLGSSHLEWFDTVRFLPGRQFVNRGIAGDRLGLTERGILHRLDVSVFRCDPAFIVFENGANDLGELWRTGTPPLDAIVGAYDGVIAAIRAAARRTAANRQRHANDGRVCGPEPAGAATQSPCRADRGAVWLCAHGLLCRRSQLGG